MCSSSVAADSSLHKDWSATNGKTCHWARRVKAAQGRLARVLRWQARKIRWQAGQEVPDLVHCRLPRRPHDAGGPIDTDDDLHGGGPPCEADHAAVSIMECLNAWIVVSEPRKFRISCYTDLWFVWTTRVQRWCDLLGPQSSTLIIVGLCQLGQSLYTIEDHRSCTRFCHALLVCFRTILRILFSWNLDFGIRNYCLCIHFSSALKVSQIILECHFVFLKE